MGTQKVLQTQKNASLSARLSSLVHFLSFSQPACLACVQSMPVWHPLCQQSMGKLISSLALPLHPSCLGSPRRRESLRVNGSSLLRTGEDKFVFPNEISPLVCSFALALSSGHQANLQTCRRVQSFYVWEEMFPAEVQQCGGSTPSSGGDQNREHQQA